MPLPWNRKGITHTILGNFPRSHPLVQNHGGSCLQACFSFGGAIVYCCGHNNPCLFGYLVLSRSRAWPMSSTVR